VLLIDSLPLKKSSEMAADREQREMVGEDWRSIKTYRFAR
jgi:hypothetical protein